MPPHGRRRAPGTFVAWLSLALLFALVAPVGAASSVLGIDLGTENIKAVLVKPGIPLEIVLTKDSRRKEQAALAFKPAPGVSSSSAADIFPERAYGADAQALAVRFPGDVFPNLKPLLGLSTHATAGASARVAGYQARYPGLALQQCSAARDTVCLRSASFAAEEEPFAVEELLAMQLQNVRTNAENMAGAGSTVTDAVITVPAFWTVDEKRAVQTAAELAGLRVLAMTTDGMAVGLHYATTRTFPLVSKGERPEYHLVFDMGAGSTTATVMRFQSRSVKDVGKFNKTVQEVQVMGAGWDTTLGGDALNELILDDLVHQLAESKPMKALNAGVDDIHKNGRTMAKLWKDTQRLRQVLSANTETQTSFESVYNGEVNFKYKITRAQFEKLAAGYDERVRATVVNALDMAGLQLKDLDSVILYGGATRTPFVQKALEGAVGRADLLKTNVNSDEAAAFGAAFRGAGISPSFRVKEIRTSEAAVMPVEMTWTVEGKERSQKLFVASSLAGTEKQVPFKTLEDFSLTFAQHTLEGGEQARLVPVSKVVTTNVTAAVKELKDKYGCEAADVATQLAIRINPHTGLPEVTRGSVSCEALEKKGAGVVEGVKNLFGFGSGKDEQVPLKEGDDGTEDAAASNAAEPSATGSADKEESTDKKATEKNDKAEKAAAEPKEPEKKVRVAYVGVKTEDAGLPRVQGDALKQIQTRMKAFDASDKNRRRREGALNDLESYAYKARDLVEDAGFIAVSTEKIRNEIAQKARDAGEWIYGDGSDAKLEEFQQRLKELKKLVNPVLDRKSEASHRDTELKSFRDALQDAKVMINSIVSENTRRLEESASLSASAAAAASSAAAEAAASPPAESADDLDSLEDAPPSAADDASEAEPFVYEMSTISDEDIAALERIHVEAQKWLDEKVAAQAKLAATEDPAFTVAELKKRALELKQAAVDAMTQQITNSQKKKSKKPKKSSSKSAKKSKSTSTTSSATGGAESSKASTTAEIKDEL